MALSKSEERRQAAAKKDAERKKQVNKAKELKKKGYTNVQIAKVMNLFESDVRKLVQ